MLIQDEISLVPAAVENMMLYRSMRARQDEGLDLGSYFHAGELMGHIPILLIAGDFLQIKPANEISLADSLEELVRKRPDKVQTEHYAAQAALMSIETVIHLKKSKRFLDVHLPEITTAMRMCTPASPLPEDISLAPAALAQKRKLQEGTGDGFIQAWPCGWNVLGEHCSQYGGEGASRCAGSSLTCQYFVLQAADQRHARKNKTIDKQLTHQLLTVPSPHRTGKLQGMLLVHENMIVRLSDVLAPHLGLAKDKMAMVDLHKEDQERLQRREPGFCQFVPEYMAKGIWVKLFKGKSSPMEDALLRTWEAKFADVADHAGDAKTLFFVELMHADFKKEEIGEENEKIEVIPLRIKKPLIKGSFN